MKNLGSIEVSGNGDFKNNLSASTLYSGSTDVEDIIKSISVNNTDDVNFGDLSATTMYSGSSDLSEIFASPSDLHNKTIITKTICVLNNLGYFLLKKI